MIPAKRRMHGRPTFPWENNNLAPRAATQKGWTPEEVTKGCAHTATTPVKGSEPAPEVTRDKYSKETTTDTCRALMAGRTGGGWGAGDNEGGRDCEHWGWGRQELRLSPLRTLTGLTVGVNVGWSSPVIHVSGPIVNHWPSYRLTMSSVFLVYFCHYFFLFSLWHGYFSYGLFSFCQLPKYI